MSVARLLVLILAVWLVSAELRSPAECADRPRLYGIKKLAVTVQADPDGDLDRQKLRAGVEAKLRSAGIRVDNSARVRLNIVIGLSTIRSDRGAGMGFAYSVHLDLTQQVYLAHNPNRLTEAVTWQAMSLGTAPAAELSARCESVVARKTDELIAVYLGDE